MGWGVQLIPEWVAIILQTFLLRGFYALTCKIQDAALQVPFNRGALKWKENQCQTFKSTGFCCCDISLATCQHQIDHIEQALIEKTDSLFQELQCFAHSLPSNSLWAPWVHIAANISNFNINSVKLNSMRPFHVVGWKKSFLFYLLNHFHNLNKKAVSKACLWYWSGMMVSNLNTFPTFRNFLATSCLSVSVSLAFWYGCEDKFRAWRGPKDP